MQKGKQSASFEVEENIELFLGLIFVVAFQFLLGLYAVSLNSLFYAHYGPFYNSMAYDNGLARMQIGAQRDGTLTTLWRTILSSTIVYPWVLFAPFAKFGIASRAVGVWIQIFAATWMQLTLFFYFLKLRSRTWVKSFAFSSAFILIAAAFDSNGGLSDFRMDLLQYLLLVTVMANYLIARKLRSLRWWALLGLTTGLLCLGRATSPVYIVPIFVVCATADLIAGGKDRRQFLIGWLLAGAVAILVAGWFFIVNYDHLYYYYVIWNPDANARLPLSKSFTHIKFAVNHIGIPLLAVLVLIALHAATQAFGAFRDGVKRHLNWRPLLFSAVPLGYLVASGAGLNPFVSIAGVGGLMIFLLDPFDVSTPSTGMRSRLLAGALIFACCVNAIHGVAKNSSQAPTWILRQEGIRDVVEVNNEYCIESQSAPSFRLRVHLRGGAGSKRTFQHYVLRPAPCLQQRRSRNGRQF